MYANLNPGVVALVVCAGLAAIGTYVAPVVAQYEAHMTRPILPLPQGYRNVVNRNVTVDGESAELQRYEREDGRNAGIGGEHFSTLYDAVGRVKGFTRMDIGLAAGQLPSREQTREIAMTFLTEFAPDLLLSHEVSWVEPHDETVRDTRNGRSEIITLSGMKVKMRNTADGRWFWVIVGADRKVMVFERDIVWVTFPGHRQTEKWLHDSWLVERAEFADVPSTTAVRR